MTWVYLKGADLPVSIGSASAAGVYSTIRFAKTGLSIHRSRGLLFSSATDLPCSPFDMSASLSVDAGVSKSSSGLAIGEVRRSGALGRPRGMKNAISLCCDAVRLVPGAKGEPSFRRRACRCSDIPSFFGILPSTNFAVDDGIVSIAKGTADSLILAQVWLYRALDPQRLLKIVSSTRSSVVLEHTEKAEGKKR